MFVGSKLCGEVRRGVFVDLVGCIDVLVVWNALLWIKDVSKIHLLVFFQMLRSCLLLLRELGKYALVILVRYAMVCN